MGWEGKAEGGRGIFTRRALFPNLIPPGYHHGYIFNNTSLEDFIRIDPREVMQYHLHVILNNVLLR